MRTCEIDGCNKNSHGARICSMHRMRMSKYGTYDPPPPRPSMEERFWAKVQPAAADECWLWTARTQHGYGHFNTGTRNDTAHRVAWQILRGEIPPGLHLDHLCRNRPCVNPWHLDPVTPEENSRRAGQAVTVCKHGHPYDQANTYRGKGDSRSCRTCHRLRERAARGYDPERTARECKRGHLWTPENTYIRPDTGHKQCKACIRLRQEAKRQAA